MTHPYDLFVSYAAEDKFWVQAKLLSALDAGEVQYLTEGHFQIGAPRIVEFERAVQQSKRTLLVLSPHYLKGNFNQYVDILVNSYGLETGSWPVIPLIIQPVDLPIRLAQLVALDATDPDEWEVTLKRLFATLELPAPIREVQAEGEPPFKGLLYFDVQDAPLFFGREALTQELAQRLAQAKGSFLAIVGASGSGKSSLARAGLIPTLTTANPNWLYRIVTPTAHPLKELAVTLTADVESITAATTLIDDLAADPRSLEIAISRFLKRQNAPHLLLLVDQFEELFTACKDLAERKAFIDNLLQATLNGGEGRLTLLLTLRADFYHHCAQYENLRAALEAHQAFIGPMTADELCQAIETPARQNGWDFEPGLVDVMLHDVGADSESPQLGALPLLSHVLLETWHRRKGRVMTLVGYHAAGGVRGAIAQTADKIYATLSSDAQKIARNIFLRLTELGEGTQDTRRRAGLDELIPNATKRAEIEDVLKTLADARLVTTEKDTAEVTHEALIREWPALRKWLDENREGLRLHRHLTEAANEWDERGREIGDLYRGSRLNQAREWIEKANPDLNELERAFLEACYAETTRQQAEHEAAQQRELAQAKKLAEEQHRSAQAQRQRSIYLTIGLIVAVLLGLLSFSLFQSSNDNLVQAKQANTQSSLNLEQANLASTQSVANASTAQAYSTQAAENASTAETRRIDAENAQATAESAKAEAESQALIARAGELSALALAQLDQQLDLALLLSVEAFKTQDVLQTESALYAVWKHNPTLDQFLQGHTDGVDSVAWGPQGQLASGSGDGTVIVWDLASGQPAQTLQGHTNFVRSVAWGPQGQLASGSGDGTVIVWDLASGQPAQTLQGHTDVVDSVAWGPQGQLASGSGDGTVIVWDLASGQPAQTLQGHTNFVRSVAWGPQGQLASGSGDETVIVWDLASGQPAQTLQGHTDVVVSVAWGPQGQLASGSGDGTVIVWDLASGQPAQTLQGHTDYVSSVAWGPQGQLASGSPDNTVIVWDLASGQPAQTLQGHTNFVRSVAWGPQGQLASASETVIVWDLASGQPAQTLQGHTDVVGSVAWGPQGQLASASETVIVWDLASGQPAQTLQGHTNFVRSVAWGPQGQLASGSGDGTVIVWDLASGQPAQTLQGHTDVVDSVAWGPQGQLASGSGDGTVIVWDLASGQPAQTLQGHTGYVWSVAWGPQGQLASGAWDGTVIVWDLASGQPAQTLQGHTNWVYGVAWGPQGQLASGAGDGTVLVWDLASGQPAQTLQGHTGYVSSVAWGPQGQLASGAWDGTVIVWDLASGQPAQTLQGHTDWVYSVAWGPQGQLASGSRDRTVIVWETRPEVWIAESCQRAGRNLTENEWNRYLSWKGPYDPYDKTCPQWPFDPMYPRAVVKEGEELARAGEIDQAIAKFNEALSLDPTLDLNPETYARQLAAEALVTEGEQLARDGNIDEAIANFTQAQEIYPEVVISANSWHELCWWGGLWNHAEDVLAACNRAVELDPENGNIRDSRGVARALTGDFEGAIEDFRFALESGDLYYPDQREEWITALEAGQNPFTDEVLEELKNE